MTSPRRMIRCPHCNAGPGQPCKGSDGYPNRVLHPTRVVPTGTEDLLLRIEAALSAAGAGFAVHVRAGDVIRLNDLARRLREAVNYTIRARGLTIELTETGDWSVKKVSP